MTRWLYSPLPWLPEEQIWLTSKTSNIEWLSIPNKIISSKNEKKKREKRKEKRKEQEKKTYNALEIKQALDNFKYYELQCTTLLKQKHNFLITYGLTSVENIFHLKQFEQTYIELDKYRQNAQFEYYKSVGILDPRAKNWEEHWKYTKPKPVITEPI